MYVKRVFPSANPFALFRLLVFPPSCLFHRTNDTFPSKNNRQFFRKDFVSFSVGKVVFLEHFEGKDSREVLQRCDAKSRTIISVCRAPIKWLKISLPCTCSLSKNRWKCNYYIHIKGSRDSFNYFWRTFIKYWRRNNIVETHFFPSLSAFPVSHIGKFLYKNLMSSSVYWFYH
jgi:hypothetical protein